MRRKAEAVSDPGIRAGFLEIAEEYEKLARQAERLARRLK